MIGTALRICRRFKASPEQLFEAWTNADILNEWFFPKAAWQCFMMNDLRLNGVFHCEMTNEDGLIHTFEGHYRQIEAPTVLAFSWTSLIIDQSMVRLQFVSQGDITELILTHDGLGDSETTQLHVIGWTGCLDQLERYLIR